MSKKILLADDSVTIQKVVELTFMDEGVAVVAVGNGSDAVARLAGESPDLVIADVHMPGLNGYEVCRRAKEWRSTLPVLLLVGTFEPFSKEEAEACGCDGSIKKPFDSQELLRQVRELLARPAAGEAAAPVGLVAEEPVWHLEPELEPETAATPQGASTMYIPVVAPAPPGTAVPPPLPEIPAWEPIPAPVVASAPAPEPVAPPTAPMAPMAPMAPIAPALPSSPTAPAIGLGSVSVAQAPSLELSPADVERIARRVVELIGEKVVREVSWEVVPDLAEVVIKDRIRELESQVE